VKLYRLQFALSGAHVKAMSYDLRGSVFVNADLRLDMAGQVQYTGDKVSLPLPLFSLALSL